MPLAGALVLGACAPAISPTQAVIVITPAISMPPAETAVIAVAQLPTQNLPTATPYPTTDFSSVAVNPTADLSDPLRFNFGTQTAEPTLSWRPPPYPVPLSIRPEDHFWFARPIASNAVNWPHPLYRYGSTNFGNVRSHTGIDLDSNTGTPVLAAGPGVVVWVGYGLLGVNPPENDPYGIAVVIKHDFGFQNKPLFTVYAHMSEASVWLDQPVTTGEQIGKVGSTGNSTGPHLHFEVRFDENLFRNSYNPELWLAPPTGWGVLAGRVLDINGKFIPELPIEVYDSRGRYYPIWSYSTRVNSDPVYKENFVLSDLPAGVYTFAMNINGERYIGSAEVSAGQTTFVIVQEGIHDIPRFADPAATNGKVPTATYTPSPTRTPTLPPTPGPTRTP